MPINTNINVNTAYVPPRVTVSVTNVQGGPPVAARVDVILSWDPSYGSCAQVIRPLGAVVQAGSCTWSGFFINPGDTRPFTIEWERNQAGVTFAIGTAHNPSNSDSDTDDIQLP